MDKIDALNTFSSIISIAERTNEIVQDKCHCSSGRYDWCERNTEIINEAKKAYKVLEQLNP